LKQIGQVLLSALRDNSPLVVAEALNAIFDLFAETEYNAIVQQLNMMNDLRSFVPFLKNKVTHMNRCYDGPAFLSPCLMNTVAKREEVNGKGTMA